MATDPDTARFAEGVRQDLLEVRKLGLPVPDAAIEMTRDLDTMQGYSSMRTAECADLLREQAEVQARFATPRPKR